MDATVDFPAIIDLNVGGNHFTTTLLTLTTFPDSMLGSMFSGRIPVNRDSNGRFFIDRDGTLFRYILNFLRSNVLSLPANFKDYELLLNEADFYQIEPLIEEIKRIQSNLAKTKMTEPISEVLRLCFSGECEKNTRLRGKVETLKQLFPDQDDVIEISEHIQSFQVGITGTGYAKPRLDTWVTTTSIIDLISEQGFEPKFINNRSDGEETWVFTRTVQSEKKTEEGDRKVSHNKAS